MNACVCCHSRLLHHLKHRRSYWFCPTCYQEMPNLSGVKTANEIINNASSSKNFSDNQHTKIELVQVNQ